MANEATTAHDDPYQGIARWYDIEHDQFEDDVQFYLEIAAGTGPHILEIGCGTGRIAIALGRSGREVVGIDRSRAMLARAHTRLAAQPAAVRARVSFQFGDARDLAGIDTARFSLAILPLNTLAHVIPQAERLSLLAAARERLVPGGRLIVDLDVLGLRRLVEAPGQLWLQGLWPAVSTGATNEEQFAFVSHFVSAIATGADEALVTHIYDAQESSGIVRRAVSQMPMALLTYGEVELALRHAGYIVEAVYGTYELDPYHAHAERAIIIAHSEPDT